jgi:hypothetical protein
MDRAAQAVSTNFGGRRQAFVPLSIGCARRRKQCTASVRARDHMCALKTRVTGASRCQGLVVIEDERCKA